MELMFIYLFTALGISFLCSILEAVLLSTPITYITVKESEGVKSATLFKELKNNIDRPISAILSLNTIAHTVGAAGVGAEATKIFGHEYFGIISAILTILILVFSEIIPKIIGASYWKALAFRSAKTIKALIIIVFPLVWISELITKIISPKNNEASFSREEFSVMADVGAKEGVFETKENIVIQNLIKLENIEVREVMTPKSVTATANANDSLSDFYANKALRPFSRIPIYDAEEEYIDGYVLFRDVLERLAEDKFDEKTKDIIRPIMAVSEHESVSAAWEKLLQHKEHIALIVNEFGDFEGIITLEDVVETILGLEIIDEKDTVADMQQLARDKWKHRMAKYHDLI